MSNDPDTPTDRETLTVDLTDDQPAEAEDVAAGDAEPEPRAAADETEREAAIEELGEREAQRLLEHVDGHTREERLSNAKAQAKESHEQFDAQRRQTVQRIEELERRDSDLDETDKRVRDLASDALCLQTLAGGITIEVPDDDRETLLGDIAETRADIADQLDQLADRVDNLERGLAISAAAFETLSEMDRHNQMLDGAGQPQPQGQQGQGPLGTGPTSALDSGQRRDRPPRKPQ